MCNLDSASIVGKKYSDYIQDALDKCFPRKQARRKIGKPTWYDKQCRNLRNEVVHVGKSDLSNPTNKSILNEKSKAYTAIKQTKKRNYIKDCLCKIEHTYRNNRSLMWKTITRLCPEQPKNSATCDDFFEYFKSKSCSDFNPNFNYDLEKRAIGCLNTQNIYSNLNSPENDVLNRNFTENEISDALDKLKLNKAPGNDGVIGEFLKFCKPTFCYDLTLLFNYMIAQRHFPDDWAEGLTSPIFKSGSKFNCANYRGITVLPVFEKVFEIAVLSRLEFISDAFDKGDRYNGGFTKGSRTSDNNLIIHGLVQRQLHLGKQLIVIHVDFSRAFDSVNRNILFYKLNKSGYKGRVIDTIFDLYKKTSFRLKINGKISDPISENIGVNQGSISSPFLFKEYLSDLKHYLDNSTGVCIGDEVLVHALWADDLYMVADRPSNSQKQLNCLSQFCSPNHMIVNEVKTKFMVYGASQGVKLYLNGNELEQVDKYKSLGTILNSIKTLKGDIFMNNTDYLNSKARSAIFAIKQKLKCVGKLPPTHWFHLYESMIEPILLYGSDLWGASRVCTANINKIYLWYIRIVLNIKATTSNKITMGETGIIPPEVKCHQSVMLYFIRLNSLPTGSVVKNVFLELERLHDNGFSNWYTSVLELAKSYKIDLTNYNFSESTKRTIKTIVKQSFIQSWKCDLSNITANPSLRTYSTFKNEFKPEPFLSLIKKPKYVTAFSRFRAGSHTLEVERGRYTNPRTPLHERLCNTCSEIEDEKHFLISCKLYQDERITLFDKICKLYPLFSLLNDQQKFVYLMSNIEEQLLTWVAKFIHDSMHKRAVCHLHNNE